MPPSLDYGHHQNKLSDYAFRLIYYLIPVVGAAPLIISLVSALDHMDALYFVLESVLPDERNRLGFISYCSLILRFIFYFLVISEMCRTISFHALTTIIALSRVESILATLLTRVQSVNKFVEFYTVLQIYACNVRQEVNCFLFGYNTIIFFTLVVGNWVMVNCSVKQFGVSNYVSLMSVLVIFTSVTTIILRKLCRTVESTKLLILKHKCRNGFIAYPSLPAQKTFNVMRLRALQPTRFSFGPFFYMGHKFLISFFWHILMTSFDVILSFPYHSGI